MADLLPNIAIRQMTLDPANFLSVIPPAGFSHVTIRNAGNVDTKVRSDPASAATEDTIFAGYQATYSQTPGFENPPGGFPRYPNGLAIVAIKPISGTGPAVLTFST
jgi:hypothetical protein